MRGAGAGRLRLRRARAALAGACCLAGALLALELPVGQLLRQRADLAAVEARLQLTKATDARLDSEIASLERPSTVAAIAHEDYGLVKPGQLAYAVLPSAGSGSSLEGTPKVPASDLLPASVSPYAPMPPAPPAHRASLWRRVLARLEFWR